MPKIKKSDLRVQIVALKGSIIKWQGIVAGHTPDLTGKNCLCCEVFDECCDCPINMDTGKICCVGTPYEKWQDYWRASSRGDLSQLEKKDLLMYEKTGLSYAKSRLAAGLAADELKYLKDLLFKLENELAKMREIKRRTL